MGLEARVEAGESVTPCRAGDREARGRAGELCRSSSRAEELDSGGGRSRELDRTRWEWEQGVWQEHRSRRVSRKTARWDRLLATVCTGQHELSPRLTWRPALTPGRTRWMPLAPKWEWVLALGPWRAQALAQVTGFP